MTKYIITITQITQGRTRNGVKPERKEQILYTQEIQQKLISKIVSTVNEQPITTPLFGPDATPA